jgi:hypothetical protein
VQAAQLLHDGLAGTEMQVVRVAENDVRAEVAQLVRVHAFDGSLRADGHEGGRWHVAVFGAQDAGAGGPVGCLDGERLHGGQGSPVWPCQGSDP